MAEVVGGLALLFGHGTVMVWQRFGHGHTTANPLCRLINLGDGFYDPPFNMRICGLLWRRAQTVGQEHLTALLNRSDSASSREL